MTPSELMTRRIKAQLEAAGSTIPVYSILLAALVGEKLETPSSGIAINVHPEEQLEEPLPHFTFKASVILTVSIDDDKEGLLFAQNYEAIWNAVAYLATGDNCIELGDENDEQGDHVFAVDGFRLSGGDDPDFQEDDNGGSFSASFEATITGRSA